MMIRKFQISIQSLWQRIIILAMLFFVLDYSQSRANGLDLPPETHQVDDFSWLNPIDNDPDHNMDNNISENQPLHQVFQLRDLTPEDWAIEALNRLIKDYNCLQGYTDDSYQGTRFLTRYEFAAGLNACLETINNLVNKRREIVPEDLVTLRQLMQIYETEIAILRGKTDGIQSRVTDLEKSQFSTTTKLRGDLVVGLVGVVGNDLDQEINLGHRTRLTFDTSFTGRDQLKTRFEVNQLESLNLNTWEGNLAFSSNNASNNLALDALLYRFPIGKQTEIALIGNGGTIDDFSNSINVFDGDGNEGALSTFGTRPPLYRQAEGKGIGLRHRINDTWEASFGYLVKDLDQENSSLFNDSYGIITQVLFNPDDRFQLGLSYLHSYKQTDTYTGSNLANFRSFTQEEFGQAIPTVGNAYGVEFSWSISDHLILGGWGGYNQVRTLSSLDGLVNRGELTIWNWALTLAFPDLGKKGNLAGFLVGVEPKVIASNINIPNQPDQDRDTSLHIEAFYQYQISQNITLTPGFIWLTAPNHNQNNHDIMIGTFRTFVNF
jgi:hypothetical protein